MMGQASTSASLRLRKAILSNDIPLVERLLQAHPQLLHNPDYGDKSNTSLHLAALHGHLELVELLISKGHDSFPVVTNLIYSNEGNNQGLSLTTDDRTALHLAASRLHVDVIELLCSEFPETVNRGDKEGRTPLLLAAGAQIETISSTASTTGTTRAVLARKDTFQSTEDVRAIEALLRHGADVKSRDRKGDTCLHQACAFGNLKTARALVQAGADPLALNNKKFTPASFSLSVQADVYFRNLVAEFEKRKAEEMARKRDQRRGNGGGHVRLVNRQDDDEENEMFDIDESGRSRAGSGRSDSTSEVSSENGLGIDVSGSRSGAWK